NRPFFNARRRQEQNLLVEKTGAELRKMMSWQKEDTK
ncbi:MAG: ketol-acid reductoisomerase, partial [Clostridiales bacterium]|nr:ketol-acid reductoisomerase [Clostridiales bacterium]